MDAGRMQVVKEGVMNAVLEEFQDKGLKFTMDDIAKRVGMSKKTLYEIFRDKDTLFDEMVEHTFSKIKEEERKVLEDPTLPIVEKVRKIMIVLPGRYENLNVRQIALMEQKYPKVYRQIQKRLESDWEPTIALLREGMEAGEIRRISIPVLKAMIEGTISQFFSRDVLSEENVSYAQALDEMMDIIMRGIEA
ncbi:MAG: TetR/AcrR family transcriptional regulator [Lachnospiraceae bacterium]|nr:TetR/AcrR family transcriptional regulator [Lachnospiraceae bacterium]